MPSRKLRGASKKCATFFHSVRRSERIWEGRIENRYPSTRKKIKPHKAIWGVWEVFKICGIVARGLHGKVLNIQKLCNICANNWTYFKYCHSLSIFCWMKMRMIRIRIPYFKYVKYCKCKREWFALRSAFTIGNINNSANANENDSHSAQGGGRWPAGVGVRVIQSYTFCTIFQL